MLPTPPRAAQVSLAPRSQDKSSPITFPHLRQSPRGVYPVVNGGFVEHSPLSFGWQDLATRYQGLPVVIGNRYQHGNSTTPVCHLNGLPARDPGEISTGVLAKLAYSNSFHVLHSSALAPGVDGSGAGDDDPDHDQGGRPLWTILRSLRSWATQQAPTADVR